MKVSGFRFQVSGFIVCSLFAIHYSLFAAPASAEVIWGSFHSSLFSDIRAKRVGDLVTLIISEASSATSSANTSTKKETEI